jgi:prepilin-type N-terminal cleavage/methylation domain-containing protein
MKKIKDKKEKGFTLIEVLVAIFILVVAVTGPMSAAQNSLKASFLARDQVVAYYLAQEPIEALKNLRNNESLEANNWIDNSAIAQCFNPSNKQCSFSVDTGDFRSCGSRVFDDEDGLMCDPLAIENGFYVQSNGDESKFTRAIFMNELTPDEAEVTVVVEWDASFFVSKRRVIVSESIFNWIPIN